METLKVGFGGGCHWCTEGVFSSVAGVSKVEQGWISALPPDDSFSEAVIVHYSSLKIQLRQLIQIHLSTHSAYADHTLRDKYRSAVYSFDHMQQLETQSILKQQPKLNDALLTTRALMFKAFRVNQDAYLNYFYQDPQKPFCQTQIKPKLEKLVRMYPDSANSKCREVLK